MPLPKIKKGDAITARYLNRVSGQVDELIEAVNPPRQRNAPRAPALQNEEPGEEPPTSYIETSRETSTVQIFDQAAENYAEIERIESITLTNGNGDKLRLVFNN